jgi:hypothetical protein
MQCELADGSKQGELVGNGCCRVAHSVPVGEIVPLDCSRAGDTWSLATRSSERPCCRQMRGLHHWRALEQRATMWAAAWLGCSLTQTSVTASQDAERSKRKVTAANVAPGFSCMRLFLIDPRPRKKMGWSTANRAKTDDTPLSALAAPSAKLA